MKIAGEKLLLFLVSNKDLDFICRIELRSELMVIRGLCRV
ncbi:hypothetical protein BRLA_c037230 [Brevibacillus laterosporus LMG 15441]|uniref:Uncharacterized protein n=1 Tax=Brevibacillus laterosporus LMG 15441 TaxID=1042163 RepID=A0A075RFA9_BRELA|nr:hypothetical protein BRLA_c037230 [Brevibacillus laterosporus LMG 15441]